MKALAPVLLAAAVAALGGCAGPPVVLVVAGAPDDAAWRPAHLAPLDSVHLADHVAARLRAGGFAAIVSGATLRPGRVIRGAPAPGEDAEACAARLEADWVLFAWIESVDRAPATETTRAYGGLALFDADGDHVASAPRLSAAPDGPVGAATRAPLEDGDPRARRAVEGLVDRPIEPNLEPWRLHAAPPEALRD